MKIDCRWNGARLKAQGARLKKNLGFFNLRPAPCAMNLKFFGFEKI
jgi:hypothetical protein